MNPIDCDHLVRIAGIKDSPLLSITDAIFNATKCPKCEAPIILINKMKAVQII